MIIGSWNGYTFEVSPTLIRGFNSLSIKGSCETKDKTKSKQKYISRKSAQPAEISLTVQLNAMCGVTNVRSEAINLVNSAKGGASAYFYIGDSKLIPAKVMLISASVENIEMSGTTWLSCDVKLSMKQSTINDKAPSAKKTTKKASTKKSSKKKSSSKSTAKSAAKKTVSSAKKASSAAKTVAKKVLSKSVSTSVVKKTAIKTTAAKKSVTTSRSSTSKGGSAKRLIRAK